MPRRDDAVIGWRGAALRKTRPSYCGDRRMRSARAPVAFAPNAAGKSHSAAIVFLIPLIPPSLRTVPERRPSFVEVGQRLAVGLEQAGLQVRRSEERRVGKECQSTCRS